MRIHRFREGCEPGVQLERDYFRAIPSRVIKAGNLLPIDVAEQASVFPPRRPAEPEVEELPEDVLEPLAQALTVFTASVIQSPYNRAVSDLYQTNIPQVAHKYTVHKSDKGPLGLPREMAWLGEPYQDELGRRAKVADALSLNHLNMPSCVGDGYFIFRGGDGFNVEGGIDFVPGVNNAFENDQPLAVSVSVPQLAALTLELTTISENYQKQSAGF